MEEAEPPESEDEEQYTQRPDGSMKKKVSKYSFLHTCLSLSVVNSPSLMQHIMGYRYRPCSEMDPPEIRFIPKVFIKERGVEIFDKSAHPLSCESRLKIPRHLVQLLANRKRIANAGMKFVCAVG
jgi:hypothetical protein